MLLNTCWCLHNFAWSFSDRPINYAFYRRPVDFNPDHFYALQVGDKTPSRLQRPEREKFHIQTESLDDGRGIHEPKPSQISNRFADTSRHSLHETTALPPSELALAAEWDFPHSHCYETDPMLHNGDHPYRDGMIQREFHMSG